MDRHYVRRGEQFIHPDQRHLILHRSFGLQERITHQHANLEIAKQAAQLPGDRAIGK
jgi:hypothetical protein